MGGKTKNSKPIHWWKANKQGTLICKKPAGEFDSYEGKLVDVRGPEKQEYNGDSWESIEFWFDEGTHIDAFTFTVGQIGTNNLINKLANIDLSMPFEWGLFNPEGKRYLLSWAKQNGEKVVPKLLTKEMSDEEAQTAIDNLFLEIKEHFNKGTTFVKKEEPVGADKYISQLIKECPDVGALKVKSPGIVDASGSEEVKTFAKWMLSMFKKYDKATDIDRLREISAEVEAGLNGDAGKLLFIGKLFDSREKEIADDDLPF